MARGRGKERRKRKQEQHQNQMEREKQKKRGLAGLLSYLRSSSATSDRLTLEVWQRVQDLLDEAMTPIREEYARKWKELARDQTQNKMTWEEFETEQDEAARKRIRNKIKSKILANEFADLNLTLKVHSLQVKILGSIEVQSATYSPNVFLKLIPSQPSLPALEVCTTVYCEDLATTERLSAVWIGDGFQRWYGGVWGLLKEVELVREVEMSFDGVFLEVWMV
ncbi:uncharacterized protein BP5553_10250 [Venustampulla echinocandica]|uniref:Uncharacterized protein n=1 Tax=Venustampulla echinocandica TaxID=2656787 RepID=A0A370T9R1_9HELO|nr:uncharacterized protein BP5553_10250 [Venustampulla echinocandica]RDL30372.1 hypothetical protein BP5553_10250 [Venustampulla echinocandica]